MSLKYQRTGCGPSGVTHVYTQSSVRDSHNLSPQKELDPPRSLSTCLVLSGGVIDLLISAGLLMLKDEDLL